MVGHDSKGESTREGDPRGERFGEEVDHEDGEGAEYEGNDAEISFGFSKRVELVGKDEEEGRMKKSGVFSVEFDLGFEVVSGIVEGMDFINP